jgi:hypothetical protein
MTMTASAAHVFGGKVIYPKYYKTKQKMYIKKPLKKGGYSKVDIFFECITSNLFLPGKLVKKSELVLA